MSAGGSGQAGARRLPPDLRSAARVKEVMPAASISASSTARSRRPAPRCAALGAPAGGSGTAAPENAGES